MIACVSFCDPVNLLWRLFGLSKEGYFYTYSALAQSMAALFGVVGIFGIYRLQVLQQEIPQRYSLAREFFRQVKAPVDHLTDEQVEEEMRNPQSLVLMQYGARLAEMWRELEKSKKKKENIKRKFLLLATVFATVTFFSLLLTGQSEYLHQHSRLSVPITGLMFLCSGGALVFMLWFAYDCLAEKPLPETLKEVARS